jgi:hypothetical protein
VALVPFVLFLLSLPDQPVWWAYERAGGGAAAGVAAAFPTLAMMALAGMLLRVRARADRPVPTATGADLAFARGEACHLP